MPAKSPRPSTYYLLTLGCPKNQVDSDSMAALLDQNQYRAVDNPRWADILIVNTCGFLAASKDESIAALQELSAHKGRKQTLIAAGCMAERDGTEILARAPGVDALLGTRRWMDIIALTEQARTIREGRVLQRIAMLGDPDPSTMVSDATRTPPARRRIQQASAYLKISDGCNAPCAFCSIPSFKGKLRSFPFQSILAEAQALVTAGAKELIVVAQDTTDYGRDRNEPNSLPQLLNAIDRRTTGLQWLRLMYAYPGHVTDELIETFANTPTLLPYLDIPLQHGHPATLRRMRRPGNPDLVYGAVAKLRAVLPDIAIRTTFIVGYPGETEAEFQGLLDFVQTMQFDRVGAFTFSPEPGTPAATLPDQVPTEVKQERWERLMAAQQPIARARNQAQVGRTLTTLVEGHGDGLTLARSYRDAPEIDGFVLIPGHYPWLRLGEMIEVSITGAMDYDLIAEPLRAAEVTVLETATGPTPIHLSL